MQPDELIKAFCRSPELGFPRDAVAFAMSNREVAIEVAHHVLDLALQKARLGEEDNLYLAPALVAYFLGYHRDESAFDTFVQMSKLDDANDVIGGVTTEGLQGILWEVSGRSMAQLLTLIDDPDANRYYRWAAASAILIGVAQGLIDMGAARAAFRTRLQNLMSDYEPEDGSDSGTSLVESPGPCSPLDPQDTEWLLCSLLDLGLHDEDYDLLVQAYDLGIIATFTAGPPSDWDAYRYDNESTWDQLRSQTSQFYPVDPFEFRRWYQSGPQEIKAVKGVATTGDASERETKKARKKRKASRKARKRSKRGM